MRAVPESAEAAIDTGRQDYSSKRYKRALEQFTRAMKLCPCARGTKRDRCSCKRFEQVAAEDGSIFNEAMYKCICHVGKTFNKCDYELHIKALDYRAATFEALKELERAKRDAEWILELAPRMPDGYLRLGKIARLLGKDEFAWKVYNAGVEAGNANSLGSSPKLQHLYKARDKLHIRFCRKDPIQLPAEIVQWILSYCDLATRVRCLRVSKTWNATFSSRGYYNLWRSLNFTGSSAPRRPVRIDGLRKLTSLAGQDVREIVIDERTSKFFLSQAKFLALLSGSRNLEHLDVTYPSKELQLPQKVGLTNTLRSLALRYIEPNPKRTATTRPDPVVEFPYSFTDHVADVIESLYLAGMPSKWLQDQNVPNMPNLKCLRLERNPGSSSPLNLMYIASKTPALEQLWLSDTPILLHDGWSDQWDKLWPRLYSLTILFQDEPIAAPLACAISVFASMHRGENLQHIDFTFGWAFGGRGYPKDLLSDEPARGLDPRLLPPSPDDDALLRHNTYRKLQSLRLSGISLDPATTGRILEQQAVDGKLTSMDIVFPLDTYQAKVGALSTAHLAGYEWLRGSSSIRTMGIYRFRFQSFPHNDDDLPLPNFLASFPSLEVLEIKSEDYEEVEFCSVIEVIMKVTKLKTIYQSQVKGALMDKLIASGKSRGVEVVWGERPREWPVVL